jgi:hypothetical protein
MKRKWFFIVPAAILGIAAFSALGGEIVKLLWNGLLPALFGWPAITFWQALGLLVLCRILFGGLGRHGGGPRWRGWHEWRPGRHLTDEDRDWMRQRIRERFGASHADAAPKPE